MKKLYPILFMLFIFLTACGGEEITDLGEANDADMNTMITGNNELAFKLLNTVEADDDGNLFLSSLSLHMALSMVYNGADTETAEEISQLLGLQDNDKAKLNLAHAHFMNQLQAEKAGINLDIANSLWLRDAYTFQEQFQANTSKYYNAEIETIDLSDQSAKRINDWVSDKTNGRIKEIVDTPMNQNLVTLLINTIYFDSDWTYPFEKSATAQEPFYLADGSITELNIMSLSEELEYFETNDFQAVKLPYGEEQTMNMQIILPDETTNVESVAEIMTVENWQNWQNQYESQHGTVKLPHFELEYEIVLNDTLEQLGMPTAFTGSADFSQMIEETNQLAISEVKQKTFLKVDEEGTEAAAATSIEVEETALVVDKTFFMEINRPFFLFITDADSGAILFNGYIHQPLSQN